ncbi:hypothetical protein [Streptomyces monashensis]|uniref:hypothetical protein n=1 Tax=Streptomyces monashensis TaxID=1678012 RepID=UPI001FEAFB8F|nr:hypothetical protein [Streptomyces monashensis]
MTDGIRGRWRALPRRARAALLLYAGGFLEGTGAHVADLARGGPHAYAGFGPLPLQVFFIALVALDPLAAVLTLRARPAGVRLAVAVMTLDVLANWYANRSWVTAHPAALLRPVGLLPITLFGLFVVATAPALLRAVRGSATADLAMARLPPIRKDAARQSGPDGNGAHR